LASAFPSWSNSRKIGWLNKKNKVVVVVVVGAAAAAVEALKMWDGQHAPRGGAATMGCPGVSPQKIF